MPRWAAIHRLIQFPRYLTGSREEPFGPRLSLLSTVSKTESAQNGGGNNNPDYLLPDAAARLAVNRLFYKEVSCAE
jgi:hypothetical protein